MPAICPVYYFIDYSKIFKYMSAHLEKDKNGKFTPKMAEYVLMVSDKYLFRLKYHMNELKACKGYFK